MQNLPFKFHLSSFQSSKFAFGHFSLLNFNYTQFKKIFFFSSENPICNVLLTQGRGISTNTKELISGGTCSIQTVKSELNLAFFAKASATEFPFL